MENENIKFLNKKISCVSLKPTQKTFFIDEIFNKFLYLFIIISLIFNVILIYILFLNNNKNIVEIEYENKTGNYSLYNIVKYPQISFIIPNIEQFNLTNDSIDNLIINLKNQTLKDIQIILSFSIFENYNYYKNVNNISILDNRIKIYYINSDNILTHIYYLIGKSIGKFIFIIDKVEQYYSNEFEKFYNFTKGKINSIFKFITNNGNSIYLIKSIIIKYLIDNDLNFKKYSDITNYLIYNYTTKLNYISIALCPDNYYTAYTYVAMLSILNSKFYYTFVSFYLILPDDFQQKNIDFLSSLYEQYDLFNITFIYMDNRYNIAYISRYLTTQTYYRFSLGELIPYLNTIIYLDTDILVYNDLTEFYNLNFNGKIILGQPTYFNKSKKTGIYKINNGVLLLNLYRMRKMQIESKVIYILNNGFKNDLHDQFLLNQFFYQYIGIFEPKYHIRPWNNYNEMIQFNTYTGFIYDNDFFYFSCKYPTILHYAYYSKPIYDNISYAEDWWYFARKSKYFKEKSSNLTSIFNFDYN